MTQHGVRRQTHQGVTQVNYPSWGPDSTSVAQLIGGLLCIPMSITMVTFTHPGS